MWRRSSENACFSIAEMRGFRKARQEQAPRGPPGLPAVQPLRPAVLMWRTQCERGLGGRFQPSRLARSFVRESSRISAMAAPWESPRFFAYAFTV